MIYFQNLSILLTILKQFIEHIQICLNLCLSQIKANHYNYINKISKVFLW